MRRFEELLEGYLAEDLSAEEEREFAALLSREENRRVFEAHRETAVLLGGVGRRAPSPSFTEEVLARLPEERSRLWEKVRDVLRAPRVLRWNLASALAFGLLLGVTPVIWRTLPVRTPATQHLARPVVTLVRFSLYAPEAERVSLAGDFNGWRTDEIFLSDASGLGHFSVGLPLKPGPYAYMFVVDGERWVTDPGAQAYRDDGFGNRNALVKVEETGKGNGDT
jgi:hypothetical protein